MHLNMSLCIVSVLRQFHLKEGVYGMNYKYVLERHEQGIGIFLLLVSGGLLWGNVQCS